MSGGAQAYSAGHVAHGVRDLLSMSPLGIGMSAADLLHAKSANDPMGAAAAAIGMVPGLKPEVQAVRQGIRAYHGSPHDFDKFDSKRIGSGEGAQAYGHGLYFAENEGVAKAYRDQLTPDGKIILNNGMSAPQTGPADIAKSLGMGDERYPFSYGLASLTSGKSPEEAVALIKEQYGHSPFLNKAIEAFQKYEPQFVSGKGKMYEVNINAKPEQFLDWDKTWQHQPWPIREKIEQIAPDLRVKAGETEGSDLYHMLSGGERGLSSDITGKAAARTSAMLQEVGIPGIRYLDQGSRNNSPAVIKSTNPLHFGGSDIGFDTKTAAENYLQRAKNNGQDTSTWSVIEPPQSRNYVLFNDQLVDIMRKYGLATPAAAGAASYAMQPQEVQAAKAQPAQFQQAAPLSDKINQMIDSLQWQDQWQGRMRLPLQQKVNNMLGESVWPPMR